MRLTALLTLAMFCAAVAAEAEAVDVDYTSQIKSIFKKRCYACHGSLKQKAGLRLDTGRSIRKGSENGAIVQKTDPKNSLLLKRVTHEDADQRMPPVGMPLTGEEIRVLDAVMRRVHDHR